MKGTRVLVEPFRSYKSGFGALKRSQQKVSRFLLRYLDEKIFDLISRFVYNEQLILNRIEIYDNAFGKLYK